MSDVVVRLRVKSCGNDMVKTGAADAGDGGTKVTFDSKRDKDIVSETGSRANEDMG
jgi:hypothetical protein